MRRIVISIAASVLLLVADIATAKEGRELAPFIEDRFTLWLGGFFPAVDSTIRLDTPDRIGDTIDFEETLGLDDGKNVWFGGARWVINPRHILEFELIQLNRSGLLEAATEVLEIGDYEVGVGGRIESVFDVTVGRLTYGYRLVDTDRTAVLLKAGLHLADVETVLAMSGNVFVDGVPITDPFEVVGEGADITAPLPHFGLSYSLRITPQLAIRARGMAFALKIDEYKGSLLDFGLDLQYRPWRRFGIGAGFRYFRAAVENDNQSKLFGEFVYEYYGPALYGIVSF